MGKEQVLKIPGIAIEKFGEFAKKFGKEAKELSSEVKTFDVISGYSPKNGEFNIFTFKDSHGKILSKDFRFGERAFKRMYFYDSKILGNRGLGIVEQTNSVVNDIKVTALIDKGDLFLRQRELYTGTGTDTVALAKLEAKKPKREITIKTSWDGTVPGIVYNNTIEKLPNHDLELLPLIMDSPYIRGTAKINHLASIYEKEHGLKGVAPKPKVISRENFEYLYGKEFKGFTNKYTGQITITDDVANGPSIQILSLLAHEYQHVKDFSDYWRIKSVINEYYKYIKKKEFSPDRLKFIKKSIAKGRIRDNSKLAQILDKINNESENYNELCKKLGHDNLFMEDRAINADIDAVTRFENIVKEVFSIIGF